MTFSRHSVQEVLRTAGESVREVDLSPAAVARVRSEASRLLAVSAQARTPAMPAAWRWQPAFGLGIAALLLAGIVVWGVLRPAVEDAQPLARTAEPRDPARVERLLAEHESRVREDLRTFRRRYQSDSSLPIRSRTEELAESLAIRSGQMRAELTTPDRMGGGL